LLLKSKNPQKFPNPKNPEIQTHKLTRSKSEIVSKDKELEEHFLHVLERMSCYFKKKGLIEEKDN